MPVPDKTPFRTGELYYQKLHEDEQADLDASRTLEKWKMTDHKRAYLEEVMQRGVFSDMLRHPILEDLESTLDKYIYDRKTKSKLYESQLRLESQLAANIKKEAIREQSRKLSWVHTHEQDLRSLDRQLRETTVYKMNQMILIQDEAKREEERRAKVQAGIDREEYNRNYQREKAEERVNMLLRRLDYHSALDLQCFANSEQKRLEREHHLITDRDIHNTLQKKYQQEKRDALQTKLEGQGFVRQCLEDDLKCIENQSMKKALEEEEIDRKIVEYHKELEKKENLRPEKLRQSQAARQRTYLLAVQRQAEEEAKFRADQLTKERMNVFQKEMLDKEKDLCAAVRAKGHKELVIRSYYENLEREANNRHKAKLAEERNHRLILSKYAADMKYSEESRDCRRKNGLQYGQALRDQIDENRRWHNMRIERRVEELNKLAAYEAEKMEKYQEKRVEHLKKFGIDMLPYLPGRFITKKDVEMMGPPFERAYEEAFH